MRPSRRGGIYASGGPLGQHFPNRLTADDGRTLGAAVVQVRHLHVIQAETPEDGRVNVMHMNRALHGAQADMVGPPHYQSRLHAAAGLPHGEAPGVVSPSVALSVKRGAA